jgi:hypothetical protein
VELRNRTPAKESRAKPVPITDVDEVEFNLVAQQRHAAEVAAGHGSLLGLDQSEQQAQAMVVAGQAVQARRIRKELNARDLLNIYLMNEETHTISNKLARKDDREKKYRTEARGGLVEGEHLERPGGGAGADGGGKT